MLKIKSKDISVVVQGAINYEYTRRVLKSIRKYLPHAEIILSTWKNSDVVGLDYDILVENTDPGAPILFRGTKQYHNLNRQIVSTLNGIKRATRKYVLKTRTDIEFTSANFLKYFDRFKKRSEDCKILKKRVLICNYYARLAKVFPFHISDWVFFGLKEDVQNIWDIPLAPEPEYTEWFYHHQLQPNHLDKGEYSYFRHRYCAEQYIWSEFLKKNGVKLKFDHMFDITDENIKLTELSFANNLVILSMQQFGINFLKFFSYEVVDIYTFPHWETLYRKYIEKKYKVGIKTKIFTNEKCLKCLKKIQKHGRNFIAPCKKTVKWVFEIFSITFYLIKFGMLVLKVVFKNENKGIKKDV